MTSLDGINGPSIQTLLRGENDSKQSDEFQATISKKDRIPLDLPLCFQSFTISYFELGYFEFPGISNSSFFPYTLNQLRYFELLKNRVRT